MPLQADQNNHAIRRIDLLSGTVTTLAGSPSQSTGHSDGVGSAASFYNPYGIAVDASASVAFVVRVGMGGGRVVGVEWLCGAGG